MLNIEKISVTPELPEPKTVSVGPLGWAVTQVDGNGREYVIALFTTRNQATSFRANYGGETTLYQVATVDPKQTFHHPV